MRSTCRRWAGGSAARRFSNRCATCCGSATRDAHEHVIRFLRPARGDQPLDGVRLQEGAAGGAAPKGRLNFLSALAIHENLSQYYEELMHFMEGKYQMDMFCLTPEDQKPVEEALDFLLWPVFVNSRGLVPED